MKKTLSKLTLKKDEKTDFDLDKLNLTLFLGNKTNKFGITLLSAWSGIFAGKQKALTAKAYVYEAARFDPANPHSSRARKILTDREVLTLGSVKNSIYFGAQTIGSKALAPMHAELQVKNNICYIKSLSDHGIIIHAEKK